jgi:hypothetical protein
MPWNNKDLGHFAFCVFLKTHKNRVKKTFQDSVSKKKQANITIIRGDVFNRL